MDVAAVFEGSGPILLGLGFVALFVAVTLLLAGWKADN